MGERVHELKRSLSDSSVELSVRDGAPEVEPIEPPRISKEFGVVNLDTGGTLNVMA